MREVLGADFDKLEATTDDEETVRHQPDKAFQAALDCVTPGHIPVVDAGAFDPEDASNPAR